MFDVFFVRGYDDSGSFFQEEFPKLKEARDFLRSCYLHGFPCVLFQHDSESGISEILMRSSSYARQYGGI